MEQINGTINAKSNIKTENSQLCTICSCSPFLATIFRKIAGISVLSCFVFSVLGSFDNSCQFFSRGDYSA